MIIIISGPSGVGKTTIIKRLLRKRDDIFYSVSVTTRQKRKQEKNGLDYYFVSTERFKEWISQDKFLEYAEVYGNLYGTLKEPIETALTNGKIVLMDLDTKGSLSVKRIYKENAILIFLISSLDILFKRLQERGTDTEINLKERIVSAKQEMKNGLYYDYIIINEHLGKVIDIIDSIITAENHRAFRKKKIIEKFLKPDE